MPGLVQRAAEIPVFRKERGAVIGVDLGTSSVKVLLVGTSGQVLARAQQSYPTNRPAPLAVEQDAAVWWEAVAGSLRDVVRQVPDVDLLSVAVTGQLNGLVLLDEEAQILRPPIIWLDRRGVDEARALNARFGAVLEQETLGQAQPINLLTKWYRVQRQEPEIARRVRWVMAPKDFIVHMLTGQVGTDFSDAGAGLLLNLRQRTYLEDVLTRAGLPQQCLPPLRPSLARAGYVSEDAAQQTGLPAGLPVAAGAGDMAALALGAGVSEPGAACVALGSAGHIAVFTDRVPDTLDPGLWLLCHALPDTYFIHALVMTGGLSLQWFHDTFQVDLVGHDRTTEDSSYRTLFALASETPAGSEELLFLPFLEGTATPLNEPHFKAAFVGATPRHRRGAFTRAVLEGVAFNVRDGIDAIRALGVPVTTLRVGGGGTRHRLWVEIIASVLGAPVEILSEMDLSSLGAAVMAGLSVGVWKDAGEALGQSLRVRETVAPNDAWGAVYDRSYRRYRELCHQLLPYFREEVRL